MIHAMQRVRQAVQDWMKGNGIKAEVLLVLITNVLLLGVLIPWARQVNTNEMNHRAFEARVQEWIEQQPTASRALRADILGEVQKQIELGIIHVEDKIVAMEKERDTHYANLDDKLRAVEQVTYGSKSATDNLTLRIADLSVQIAALRGEIIDHIRTDK